MKRFYFLLCSVLVLGFMPGLARADSACGGIIQMKNDCLKNGRSWHINCCPDNYRVQGVAYDDHPDQDHADAVGPICRKVGESSNPVMPEDYSKTPKTFECDKTEVMAGIYDKDVLTDSGDKRDTLDGVTAVCQKPGSEGLRKIANRDIEGGREGREQTVLLPKRVVGIAYKELDKGSSDRADCVTIITK
ncbi:MAG: hypothetical protein HYU99_12075 [Deltaproteobacteria bacterium]|nr:hypothetical protein [Deltaproteobacteria bacterium]